jgi:large subunit ribosomal protein L25
MKTVAIEGTLRTELGKKASSDLRKQDMVPCVIYGGENVTHFYAHINTFKPVVYTPDFIKVEVTVDGKTTECIVKDLQFDPVKDTLTHVDFLQLVPGKKLEYTVPVRLAGVAKGVREGGTLMQKVRRIKVQSTPESMMDALSLDITELELGKSVRIRDIKPADGISILQAASIPVATIEIPRALRSAQTKAETPGKKK